MCGGSEAGSYLRLTDFVYHSPLGVRVIKKKRKRRPTGEKDVVSSLRSIMVATPPHTCSFTLYLAKTI
jgi:hypothetical protein